MRWPVSFLSEQQPLLLYQVRGHRYLEGQGDLVTGLIMGIIGVSIWVIGVITLLTKSP